MVSHKSCISIDSVSIFNRHYLTGKVGAIDTT